MPPSPAAGKLQIRESVVERDQPILASASPAQYTLPTQQTLLTHEQQLQPWSVFQPTATTAALQTSPRGQMTTPTPENVLNGVVNSNLIQFEEIFPNYGAFSPSTVDASASAMLDGVRQRFVNIVSTLSSISHTDNESTYLSFSSACFFAQDEQIRSDSSVHLGRILLPQLGNGHQQLAHVILRSSTMALTHSYSKKSLFT